MRAISNYYGSEEYEGLQANILIDGNIPVVEFIKDGQLIETRRFPDNTMRYVEDAAENYVMGVLKL